MPFRERVKRAFGRTGSITDGSSLKKTNTKDSSNQASEPLPKPKYRGPVDPKHKEKLEGFSFGSSWRRKSATGSLYSPFGSKLPSRNNSLTDPRKFFGRGPSHVGKVMENTDDSGDVSNVGGTRHQSAEESTSGPMDANPDSLNPEARAQAGTQEQRSKYAHDHRPFSEAEVSNVLQKVTSRRPDS